MDKDYKYQDRAVNSLLDYYNRGETGHPLIVAPTGSGKTHILGKLLIKIRENNPKAKVLILSHVQEILSQDYRTVIQYVPKSQVGIWSSGLKRKEKRQYTIAGIQSIYKHGKHFIKYDWVIIDEAHLIPPSGDGRYLTFLRELKWSKIIGLTATPFRMGHGMLTDSHIFSTIVFEIDIVKLIEDGYLCPLVSKQPNYTMKTNDVKIIAGDFSKSDLSNHLDDFKVTNTIVKELTNYILLRKKWLIFAIDIEHAEHITRELIQQGVMAEVIHSRMDESRTEVLRLFHLGKIQALVSVETLTTGFDAPDIDMIVLMRPTRSPVLHVQMIGRGLRIAPQKKNCLVLDFAGNITRLGPINDVHLAAKRKKGKGKGNQVFAKTCPSCRSILHPRVMLCPDCGYVFPKTEKLNKKAATADIIASKPGKYEVRYIDVDNIVYAIHHKRGGRKSLKVSYRSGLEVFNEWIGFEHTGYPRHKAKTWWELRSSAPTPETVHQAKVLSNTLRRPSKIGVLFAGKYPEIIKYVF